MGDSGCWLWLEKPPEIYVKENENHPPLAKGVRINSLLSLLKNQIDQQLRHNTMLRSEESYENLHPYDGEPGNYTVNYNTPHPLVSNYTMSYYTPLLP